MINIVTKRCICGRDMPLESFIGDRCDQCHSHMAEADSDDIDGEPPEPADNMQCGR